MKRFSLRMGSALAALCFGPGAAGNEVHGNPVPIGLNKQLLVDDYVIAEKNSLRRVLGRVSKANGGRPVMVADRPWESGRWGLFGFYGTVLHDGEKFRMWYHPWRFAVAYAESTDGLHWHKPALGLRLC